MHVAEEQTLAKRAGRRFLPGTLAEWTGIFLFAVGVYGTHYRSLTRHLTLWGKVPLDAFYMALLFGGALLMIGSASSGPWRSSPDAPTTQASAWLFVGRTLLSLTLLAILVWFARYR